MVEAGIEQQACPGLSRFHEAVSRSCDILKSLIEVRYYIMSNSPSKEQAEKSIKWLNANRKMGLDLYKNQYIAYNEEGIISYGENLQCVLDIANESGKTYLIYLVPPHRRSLQIL